MTAADQVDAALARQLADAEATIQCLKNGRTADAGQLTAMRERWASVASRLEVATRLLGEVLGSCKCSEPCSCEARFEEKVRAFLAGTGTPPLNP